MRPRCCYYLCKAEAVGEYPRNVGAWPFCSDHAKQEAHPSGINMQLFQLYPTPK